jgi:hypothetical protein
MAQEALLAQTPVGQPHLQSLGVVGVRAAAFDRLQDLRAKHTHVPISGISSTACHQRVTETTNPDRNSRTSSDKPAIQYASRTVMPWRMAGSTLTRSVTGARIVRADSGVAAGATATLDLSLMAAP